MSDAHGNLKPPRSGEENHANGEHDTIAQRPTLIDAGTPTTPPHRDAHLANKQPAPGAQHSRYSLRHMPLEICQLYISPGHNFFGHHGREPDEHLAIEVPSIECVAGHGIRGDRFFDYKENYKGQITFFALEVFEELSTALNVQNCSSALVRRNVITRGVDLDALIEQEFEIQGVRFHGTGECRPCYWMDRAIAPCAEEFLKGRGGLRARILSNGVLHSGARIAAAA